MKVKTFLLASILFLFSYQINAQMFSGCENVSAFNKNSRPDLAVVIYSNDAETVWNALRLAIVSQQKGDTVVVFVLGKGVDAYLKDTSGYKIHETSLTFLSNGGNIYTCATCAKHRNTEEVQYCTITSIADLYEIIQKSKKLISF